MGTTYRALILQAYPDLDIEFIHHAGNSSGVVDGAGAVLLASPDYAKAQRAEAARPRRGDGQHGRQPDADAERARCRPPARCWRRPA